MNQFRQVSINYQSLQRIIDSPYLRREINQIVNKFNLNLNRLNRGRDFLLSYFHEGDITDDYLPVSQVSFTNLQNFLHTALSELANFQQWLNYKQTYERLQSLTNQRFLDILRENNLDSALWFLVLEKRIYQTCLDAILAEKPELRNFNFQVHERQIQEF